ncbi:MAG: TraR/DksA family transcriptional regulator [candidate division KSB1 bacterium]|nr:TraR/DksA family transcriptional regulator [candidate division KSB1 bacterium]MDZ7304583.1 TraR/DksA family transcriptional regulator [candidate division KSB1 bacterium]MDZ7313622.1 TraR/DksA family transcriptional regulator [candidate division KSB1 bacterium]
MTRKQLQFYKNLLERQRSEILREWAHEHRDYREMAEVPADVYDRATLDGSKEFAALLSHGDSQRWLAINTALAKIESGDYGLCDECGQPINAARLEAMPTAAFCLRCQRSYEERQRESGSGAVMISEEKWEENYWGD